ncbi:MAG: hypothetical protein L3J22_11150 [Xanthomonadales bacterium]|nr:hypothetical protein [Xanthomonadales bacterium]
MKDNNSVSLKTPLENPLEALLKQGARDLLSAAIDTVLVSLLEQFNYLMQAGGTHGYLPERSIQSGLGGALAIHSD